MIQNRRDFVAGTAAVLAGSMTANAGAQSAMKVELGDVSRTATSWCLEIARVNGFFTKEKLDVDTTYVGNNPAVAQQVVGNALDLGLTTVETAIRAVESGAPIVMIGSGMLKFPYNFMAATSINSPADLKGKKIILDLPKSYLSYTWQRWSKQNHLQPDDVEIVYDGSSTNRFAALVAGAVVLAPVTQPLDFMALDRGYKKLIDVSVFAANFGFTAIVARKAYLEQNGAIARAFMKASAEATDFFYDKKNRDASITALVNFSKVEPATAARVYDFYTTQLHPYTKGSAIPDVYVKTVADYLVTAGELKSAGPPSKYVDHRFLE
jgi:ABC-type nitrate/sulfonate/bicarbonate transport system substrate-binding protein